uniref:Uncharacterized protein n=1 Tax=Ciona intestinalis TaxID=7719 RepID=H2XK48_CIOIN
MQTLLFIYSFTFPTYTGILIYSALLFPLCKVYYLK